MKTQTKTYRFYLDKSSKKFECPACKERRFVRYVDTQTKQYASPEFGRCDRLENCGYSLYPKTSNTSNTSDTRPVARPVEPKAQVYIPIDILAKSQQGYEANVFIQGLVNRFDSETVEQVKNKYGLGTISKGYLSGAVTFPYIDKSGKIAYIAAIRYGNNLKRVKSEFAASSLAKYYLKALERQNKPVPIWLSEYNNQRDKITCFFGEHLLNQYPKSPVLLFEAPKTAIIAALAFGMPKDANDLETPICLASGAMEWFKVDKAKALKNRVVHLYPDLDKENKALKIWIGTAKDAGKTHNIDFYVSYLVQNSIKQFELTSDAISDLADLILEFGITSENYSDLTKHLVALNPKTAKKPVKSPVINDNTQSSVNVHSNNKDAIQSLESPNYSNGVNSVNTVDTVAKNNTNEGITSPVQKLINQLSKYSFFDNFTFTSDLSDLINQSSVIKVDSGNVQHKAAKAQITQNKEPEPFSSFWFSSYEELKAAHAAECLEPNPF